MDNETIEAYKEYNTEKLKYFSKTIASIVVCIAGTVSMYITDGETGIGWSIVGLIVIWNEDSIF